MSIFYSVFAEALLTSFLNVFKVFLLEWCSSLRRRSHIIVDPTKILFESLPVVFLEILLFQVHIVRVILLTFYEVVQVIGFDLGSLVHFSSNAATKASWIERKLLRGTCKTLAEGFSWQVDYLTATCRYNRVGLCEIILGSQNATCLWSSMRLRSLHDSQVSFLISSRFIHHNFVVPKEFTHTKLGDLEEFVILIFPFDLEKIWI